MDRRSLGFPEARRAARFQIKHPVQLEEPVPGTATTVNVSSCGLLIRLDQDIELSPGESVSLTITRTDGEESLNLHGKIVRVERKYKKIQIAIDLAP